MKTLLVFASMFAACLQGAGIAYVQGNYATPHPSSSPTVTVTYPLAQAAGDLNVVVVGWNDSTHTVVSVKDKSGNSYSPAVGPTLQTGFATQTIYYAKSVAAAAAGANVVTVTFNATPVSPDIRVLEYSGADPATPVDVVAFAMGNNTLSQSSIVTTTNAADLLFAANITQTTTTGPGTGFTGRMITQPDGDIIEDRSVTASGAYSASAPTSSGPWIMQMVAFRAAGTVTNTNPTVTGLAPSSGSTVGGTAVVITGTNFSAAATVTIGGKAATNVVVLNSTSITATTPVGTAGSVAVAVTSNGLVANLASGFTYVVTYSISGTVMGLSGAAFVLQSAASTTASVASNVEVFSFSGLVNGTYVLTPALSGYSFNPASQTVTIAGANQVVTFVATPLVAQSHSVTLSWGVASIPDPAQGQVIAGYDVLRGSVSGGPYAVLNKAVITGLSYVDSLVQAGQTFFYVATALDNLGDVSSYSNEAVVTVP